VVNSAQFSADGQRVVTASGDKTARVWDAATGKALSEPMKHDAAVSSAQFSADGQRVVTASGNTARVWDIPTITTKDSADDVNLLADLAEATAGLALQAFGETEILAALTPDQVKATRDGIAVKFPGPFSTLTPLQRFLKWSVSGARTRPISPFSNLTVAEWVQNRIQEGTLDDLRAAMLVDPVNARLAAHFGMALAKLANLPAAEETDADEAQRSRAEAVFQTGRALKLAPDNDEVKAMAQNNLANAPSNQPAWAERAEPVRLLGQAVEAYRQALEVYTVEPFSHWNWTLTQNNLANALSDQAPQAEGAEAVTVLGQAVEAYRQALEIRTREHFPQDWAATQYNLGAALEELGTRSGAEEGRKPLEDAVAAYRSALEVRTKADLPQDWAATQNNLGVALQELGTRSAGEEGRKLLEDAVAAYRSALEVRTKADLPQDWAATQNNLGITLEALGDQLEGEEGLKRKRESVELLRDVVSYQPDDQSRYWLASALGGLAFNLVLNSQFAEAQTRCEEAQRLANEIGDGVKKTNRDDLILIQQNLAHALLFQGHYDEALAIYRQNWDKPQEGKTFGEFTLEDFAAFDKAGLTHPDLSRMKRALEELFKIKLIQEMRRLFPFTTSKPRNN
jgi:tetratricopeptide (TPR) repeat protein